VSDARVKRNSGATTVIKNGRIIGNLPGPSANPPSPADEAVLTPPSITDENVGDAADIAALHDMYASRRSVRTDGDFLAPASSVPVEISAGDDGISTELYLASETVMSTLGVSAPGERYQILTDSAKAIGPNRDTRILPPEEAAMEVSLAMNMQKDNLDQQVFLDRVRRGELSLTVSEVAILHNVRDEVLAARAAGEASNVPFDEEGVWSPPYSNRLCTLCGKFIGELGSHSGHCSPMVDLHTRNESDARTAKISVEALGEDGAFNEEKLQIPSLAKRHEDLSIETLQDAFLASSARAKRYMDDPNAWICRSIIGRFIKKPLLGKARLALPKELRDAYLASSVRQPRPAIVAQLIDPPFSPGELEHLMDTDFSEMCEDTRGLLTAPSVRDEAVRILENSPSRAGRTLAQSGRLPIQTIRNMATSGDAVVRMQAMEARNLSSEEALLLAADPDPDIRKKMLRKIEKFPEMLESYVNDPDEEIAIKALSGFPGSRQAAVAISKVTSRKRLQAIHDRLPEAWIPAGIIQNSRPNDPHPQVRAVNSVQEWIRTRLDEV